jgi:hypothetical protein
MGFEMYLREHSLIKVQLLQLLNSTRRTALPSSAICANCYDTVFTWDLAAGEQIDSCLFCDISSAGVHFVTTSDRKTACSLPIHGREFGHCSRVSRPAWALCMSVFVVM